MKQSTPGKLAPARLQQWRLATQLGFFALFVLAPALNLLRFDLTDTQLWFLGQRWSLGIDALAQGQISATDAALQLVWRAFVPGLLLVAVFLGVAYRYGRLYCGWLCPHFSMVELLNKLLHRACGKLSFWGGLVEGTLTPNQSRFLLIVGTVFTLEFAFARHLFCRFGCAVGLFQSLAWMANPKGMVVAFARERARECKTCDAPRGSACDNACPMRLNPRNIKRMMFSCVQCGQCLTVCDATQQDQQRTPTLEWQVGVEALSETLRQRQREQSSSH